MTDSSKIEIISEFELVRRHKVEFVRNLYIMRDGLLSNPELTTRQKAGLATLDLILQDVSEQRDEQKEFRGDPYGEHRNYWDKLAVSTSTSIKNCIEKYKIPQESYTPLIEQYFELWVNHPPDFETIHCPVYYVMCKYISAITNTLFPDI